MRNRDFYMAVLRGQIPGMSIVQKFGANVSVGTSLTIIAEGGIYPTPQVSAATPLRIKAGGDSNDTAAGSGAREITLQGLNAAGLLITETLATAGASASSVTDESFLRLFRAWVSASGTYATAVAGSHAAQISIENGAGGTDWGLISTDPFPKSQTEIGVYSVPFGFTAYIVNVTINVDSGKTATVLGFKRENILETAAPYSAMRSFIEFGGVSGEGFITPKSGFGPFPALTDVGFMGKMAAGSGEIDVDFEILLVEDNS